MTTTQPIRENLPYHHPKHGYGYVISNRWDDGAAYIFEPLAEDGDCQEWEKPLWHTEKDEIRLVGPDEWTSKFPEMKYPTEYPTR